MGILVFEWFDLAPGPVELGQHPLLRGSVGRQEAGDAQLHTLIHDAAVRRDVRRELCVTSPAGCLFVGEPGAAFTQQVLERTVMRITDFGNQAKERG